MKKGAVHHTLQVAVGGDEDAFERGKVVMVVRTAAATIGGGGQARVVARGVATKACVVLAGAVRCCITVGGGCPWCNGNV